MPTLAGLATLSTLTGLPALAVLPVFAKHADMTDLAILATGPERPILAVLSILATLAALTTLAALAMLTRLAALTRLAFLPILAALAVLPVLAQLPKRTVLAMLSKLAHLSHGACFTILAILTDLTHLPVCSDLGDLAVLSELPGFCNLAVLAEWPGLAHLAVLAKLPKLGKRTVLPVLPDGAELRVFAMLAHLEVLADLGVKAGHPERMAVDPVPERFPQIERRLAVRSKVQAQHRVEHPGHRRDAAIAGDGVAPRARFLRRDQRERQILLRGRQRDMRLLVLRQPVGIDRGIDVHRAVRVGPDIEEGIRAGRVVVHTDKDVPEIVQVSAAADAGASAVVDRERALACHDPLRSECHAQRRLESPAKWGCQII